MACSPTARGVPGCQGVIDAEPCSASDNLLPTAMPPLSARANRCGRVPALSGGGSSPNAATAVGGVQRHGDQNSWRHGHEGRGGFFGNDLGPAVRKRNVRLPTLGRRASRSQAIGREPWKVTPSMSKKAGLLTVRTSSLPAEVEHGLKLMPPFPSRGTIRYPLGLCPFRSAWPGSVHGPPHKHIGAAFEFFHDPPWRSNTLMHTLTGKVVNVRSTSPS